MESINDFVQKHIHKRIDEEIKHYDHDVRCIISWCENFECTLEDSGWHISQIDDKYIIYSDYQNNMEVYDYYEERIKHFSNERFKEIEKSKFEDDSSILISKDDLFLAMGELVIKDELEIFYEEANGFYDVSDFLAEELIKKGEKITRLRELDNSSEFNVWSRVTVGQEVTQDKSIKEIFQEVING